MESSSSSAMDISPDPVSLRAAALSTLKRRKTMPDKATITMPPSRPTHTISDFQLDYGQEDGMAVDSQPPPPHKFSPKSTHKALLVTNDIQMREEGEISDEEEILHPKQSPPPPPRKSKSPVPAKALSPQPVKVVEPKSASPHQKSPALEERAPLSLLERFSGYAPSNEGSETDILIPESELDSSLSSLGPDRVRPGLFLTMDEYDTAKDIILDLLGWGVPPEFLIDCGLTKELVFYVFTELNLRLPDNFDSSGIVSYNPESFSQRQQSVLMPPPPLPENNRTIDTTVEVTPRVSTPPLRPSTIPSFDSPSNTDLHDMERQRRQELLARKAVQASRRLKRSTSIEPPVETVISTEVIDDFLNSIGPVRDTEHLNGVLPPSPLSSTHPRRGVRPVASDFVDLDPAPGGNGLNTRLEPPAFTSGITQRLNLTANFRDIGSRRCVIDLSDSEDDDERDIKNRLQQSAEDQPWLKCDRRSKASNYHPPASTKSSLSGNQSPAALMMKELEIRRMRELIAKREEETRLKKLASAKSSVNTDMRDSLTPVNHLPSLKQEEVDVVMNPDSDEQNGFGNNRSSESATSPPRSVSKSSNDGDIQDDLLNHRDPTLVHPSQDLASDAQEAQAIAINKNQFVQEKEQQLALRQGMVDADPEASPSTQVNQKTTLAIPKQDANEVSETATAFNDNSTQQNDGKYRAYHSIFELYPLLRGYSWSMSSDRDFPSHLSSRSSLHMSPSTRTSLSSSPSVLAEPSSYFLSSSSLPELNLEALKLAAIGKVLDPFKLICRYEIPGGGTCRDEGCDDVHLSRLQGVIMEPSDQDVAQYLFNTLPREWLVLHQVSSTSKIVDVLQKLRGHSSLDDRVDQALLTFGLLPT